MLKRQAILVVFWATTQTVAFVPVHASNTNAQYAQSPKNSANTGQQPARPVPIVDPQKGNNGPERETNPNQEDSRARRQPITIPEGVTVQIAENGVNWSIVANLILAVVGVVGIVIAVGTLLFVKAQVVEMRRQRSVMRRTLIAIKMQADLMEQQTVQLERQVTASHDGLRAWIGVDVREIQKQINMTNPIEDRFSAYPSGGRRFIWEVTNYGQTPAFIRSVCVTNAAYSSMSGTWLQNRPPLALDDFLGSNKSKEHALTLEQDALGLCEERKMFWRVAVKIGYDDAFSRSHETMVSFHYYVPETSTDPLRKGFYQDVDPATNYNT